MASGKKSSSEEIIDLTELIEKGEAEAPAAARKAQAQVHHDDDDIEALLADMDAGDVAPKSAPRKVDANEHLDMTNMGGIDDLLESLDIPPQPQDSPPETPTPLDNAVDDLMTNGNGKPKSNVAPRQANFADDLDALLDTPEPKPAKKAKQNDDLDSALDDLFTSLNERPGESPEAPQASHPDPVDDDLDDILSSIDEPAHSRPTPAKPAAKPAPSDFPDDLDDLLNGTEQPKPVPDELLEDLQTAPPPITPAPEAPKSAPKSKPVPQKLVAEAKRTEDNLAKDMLAQTPTAKSSVGEVNYAINANLENLNFQARDLGQRLQNCETDLAQTRLRIECLEKSAANAASIEDLLRDGSPLHSGFAALIATSVGQVLQDTRENGADSQVMSRLQQIEIGRKGLEDTLEALESRLAALEKQGEDSMQVAEKFGDLVQDSNQNAERLDAMENRLESIMPNLGNALQLADHYDELLHASARLDALENSFGELASKTDETGVESGLKALEQETLSIKSSLEALENDFAEKAASNQDNELLAKIEEVEQQAEASLADLERKIASLASENMADALVSRVDTCEQEAMEAKTRLESMETKIDAFAANDDSKKLEANIDEVKQMASSRLDELEGKFESLANAIDVAQEMTTRLDNLEQDAVTAKTGLEAFGAKLDAFAANDGSKKLEANIDEVKQMASSRLDGLEGKFESLANAMDAAQEMTTRLDNLEQDTVTAKTGLEDFGAKLDAFAANDDSKKLEANIDEVKQMASSRLDELEGKFESLANAKDDMAQELTTRLDNLEQDAVAAKTGLEDFGAKLDAFAANDGSKKLEANIDEVRQMANARIEEIQDKLNSMEADKSEEKGLAERLDGIEQDALAAKNRLQAVETQLGGVPQIETVETSLLAKVGSVEQEARTAKDRIEVLEGRLGALESRQDTEASIYARLEDINSATKKADSRMDKLEEALVRLTEKQNADSAPQTRLDNLEKAVGNRIDDLEKKLAVLEEISQKTAAIMGQLQTMEKTSRSVCFRMDAVESRLDNLEPRFNKEIEKAATNAVARVLREEISRLAADV